MTDRPDPPTCLICGEPIKNEPPVYVEPTDRDEIGEYDGEAYHLNKCEEDVFEEVYKEVDADG